MKKATAIAALILSGCASNPDYDLIIPAQYTEQDKRQHFYECKLQARTVLPGVSGNIPPIAGAVGGFAQGYASASSKSRVTYDMELMKECLEVKGYRFVYK